MQRCSTVRNCTQDNKRNAQLMSQATDVNNIRLVSLGYATCRVLRDATIMSMYAFRHKLGACVANLCLVKWKHTCCLAIGVLCKMDLLHKMDPASGSIAYSAGSNSLRYSFDHTMFVLALQLPDVYSLISTAHASSGTVSVGWCQPKWGKVMTWTNALNFAVVRLHVFLWLLVGYIYLQQSSCEVVNKLQLTTRC